MILSWAETLDAQAAMPVGWIREWTANREPGCVPGGLNGSLWHS